MDQFNPQPAHRDGLASWCRPCERLFYGKPLHLARPAEGFKVCAGCRHLLPVESFGISRAEVCGLKSRCKPCANAQTKVLLAARPGASSVYSLRWQAKNPDRVKAMSRRRRIEQHGLTVSEFDARVLAQGGLCAICSLPEPLHPELSIDHDHRCCPGKTSCGKCVRGLLCSRCNPSIGKFYDDSALLRRAADYIDGFSAVCGRMPLESSGNYF